MQPGPPPVEEMQSIGRPPENDTATELGNTYLAWGLGGVPAGYADAVRRIPSIRSVAEVRSGTAWLTRWSGATGPSREPPAGLDIPVEVATVAPRSYARLLPSEARRSFERLGTGEALLARTAASIRGIGLGGTLQFADVALRVTGVVNDGLVGEHEVVVSGDTGKALGITEPRYVLAVPARDADPSQVQDALRAALPDGRPLRIRAPGEAPVLRHADLTLSPLRLKEFFGEFAAAPAGGALYPDRTWVEKHIGRASVPILGEVTCHRRLLPLVAGALVELVDRDLASLIDPAGYGGCYAPRFIGRDPGAGLSHHAWGAAIDINVPENPLGAKPRLDRRVVRVMERWGFVWGGRFIVPDGHHFELRRFPEGDGGGG